MEVIDKRGVSQLLAQSRVPEVCRLSNDVSVVKALVALFAATLQIAGGRTRGDLLEAGAGKINSVVGLAATATDATGLKTAEFVGTQVLKTIGLRALSGASPAKAGVVLSFTIADKAIAAAGMGEQFTFSKCQLAVASLVTTTGLTSVSCVGTAGMGCVVGALMLSNEILNTNSSCRSAPK